MTTDTFTGWDIGGAHLKMAIVNNSGRISKVIQFPSPLWLGLNHLDHAIANAAEHLPAENNNQHVITMTAELADIFENRRTGVMQIVSRFTQRFGDRIKVYAGRSGLLKPSSVEKHVEEISSANWYATANYAARKLDNGVLIDIGSTTTDIIPFLSGRCSQRGNTDQERMQYNELVYTGIIRTPVMAIVNRVPYIGEWQSVAAECFSTMADVYRLTGELNEKDDMMAPADGAEKTTGASIMRLARMIGTDSGREGDLPEWRKMAIYIAEQQLHMIQQALFRVLSGKPFAVHTPLIGAGCGRFLARKLAQRTDHPYRDFAELLDVDSEFQHAAASCAPAVCVAELARGQS